MMEKMKEDVVEKVQQAITETMHQEVGRARKSIVSAVTDKIRQISLAQPEVIIWTKKKTIRYEYYAVQLMELSV